jgi:uncharacterized protein (DUF2126 family)
MVPEPEPLLAANVLLRALTACFAEKPYTLPLIDWRESLHDKFMLPLFLKEDLRSVIDYLNAHGFSFADDVFDEQINFRFPVITQFDTNDVHWTLRHAIEPWPVMGEHEGTGRVVDSTTDRLELRADGAIAEAGLIASVNGIRMPLHAVSGSSAVGGIRYRLFDNPWGLQPHINAHSPLRIAIIEEATNQVVHAFDYFNWKLIGQGYDGLPSNAKEASTRVAERLADRPELIGSQAALVELSSAGHAPFTLDLRRSST